MICPNLSHNQDGFVSVLVVAGGTGDTPAVSSSVEMLNLDAPQGESADHALCAATYLFKKVGYLIMSCPAYVEKICGTYINQKVGSIPS